VNYPEKIREQAEAILVRYPEGRERSALLPLLHLVQSHDGYVSDEGIAFCAEVLDITKAQVQAVSTFYTMYKREPAGDWLVSVCTNTLCQAKAGRSSSTRSATNSTSATTRPPRTARSRSSTPSASPRATTRRS